MPLRLLLLAVLAAALSAVHSRPVAFAPISNSKRQPDNVVGGLQSHARAITCANGGWFKSIEYATTNNRISGLYLCCSNDDASARGRADPQLWYEGASDEFEEACYWIGKPASTPNAQGVAHAMLLPGLPCLGSLPALVWSHCRKPLAK